jgi:hypothetical protein
MDTIITHKCCANCVYKKTFTEKDKPMHFCVLPETSAVYAFLENITTGKKGMLLETSSSAGVIPKYLKDSIDSTICAAWKSVKLKPKITKIDGEVISDVDIVNLDDNLNKYRITDTWKKEHPVVIAPPPDRFTLQTPLGNIRIEVLPRESYYLYNVIIPWKYDDKRSIGETYIIGAANLEHAKEIALLQYRNRISFLTRVEEI